MSSFSQVAKTLPLPFAPTLQAAIRQPARKPLVRPPLENTRTKPLWLAIELPQLGLEAICHKQNSPVIVSEEARGRVLVSVANAVARQYGIHAGMPVNAAWALCPELQVAMREPSKEIIKLHELAKVIYGYSSVISVQPPNLLLVEIRASLRLFGVLGIFPRKRTKTSGSSVISGLSEGITFPELAYIHQLRASAPQDPVTFHSIRSYRYP